MPKNIEDMIVPERKRSIRDIPIPEGRRKFEKNEPAPIVNENNSFQNLSSAHFETTLKEYGSINKKSKVKWVASGIALIILTFTVLSIFNGATLAYIPKSQAVSFNDDLFTAHQSGEGGVLYSVVKLSLDKGLEVSATGEETVERRASGTIIIYNTGKGEQKLRATTRFETPEGKIYQVLDAISIPGKKVVGGVDQPGTLETVVYAERPGNEFNIGLTDLTLPGLKGTSLFSSVYARSKNDISGGFVGLEKTVNSQDKVQVKAQLETLLRDELISEAKAQVPVDFILLPSLSTLTFKELPQTDSTSKESVVFNMRADLLGVMFKRSDLVNYLILNKIKLLPGEVVDLDNLDVLNFVLTDATTMASSTSNSINFSVKGESKAVWWIDEVALKADLTGRSKKDMPSILNNYPNVLSATATIRPFWKSTFPSDSANITLKRMIVQ